MFTNKEYVYAVYKEKSFSKAAQKLYITQPCLSAMVKKVESKLGFPIFERNTRMVQLTEYGEKYIECIEKINKMEEDLQSYLDDVRGIKTGHISIGASNAAISFVLPELINNYLLNHPHININIIEGNREYLNRKMKDGSIDIILDNYPVDTKVYEKIHLLNERLFIAVPKTLNVLYDGLLEFFEIDHSATMTEAETLPEFFYHDNSWIAVKKGNDTRERFDLFCSKYNISTGKLFEVDQLTTAFHIAARGLGMTIVSDTLIRSMDEANRLLYYPIPETISKRSLFFHYPKQKYVSLPLKQFIIESQLFFSRQKL